MHLFDFSLYHCVDDLGSIPGVSSRLVEELERRAVPAMDVVVATSSALQDRLKTLNPNTHYFHNVADADHFARATQAGSLPLDLAGIPDPRAIFAGALSDHKIDWPLLIKVAELLPQWSFVMIGPIGEEIDQHGYESAMGTPNIHLLGHRSYEELPDYMRGGRVGLIPYRLTEHTASIFPMKALEYLAAGLSVISTPLPAFQGHPDIAVVQRSDAEGFADALTDVLGTDATQGKSTTVIKTWDDLLTNIFSLISLSLIKLPASDI
jgi:glycosyltransferase involved in cell wall biosynthesis